MLREVLEILYGGGRDETGTGLYTKNPSGDRGASCLLGEAAADAVVLAVQRATRGFSGAELCGNHETRDSVLGMVAQTLHVQARVGVMAVWDHISSARYHHIHRVWRELPESAPQARVQPQEQ
jgi:hypothetical protein